MPELDQLPRADHVPSTTGARPATIAQPSPGSGTPPVTAPTLGANSMREGSLQPELAALAASGAPPEVIEEMITLYHVSTAPGWAQSIAQGKQSGRPLDQLRQPIDPFRSKNLRTLESNFSGDGRGGDDLGPGFYTGDSPEFADHYGRDLGDRANPAGVLAFQLPRSALDALRVKNIAPDDDATFQQYMQDGFMSAVPETGEMFPPRLDQLPPQHDLISGPINDVSAAARLGPRVVNDDVHYSQGSILQFGDQTPLQYNWASQLGVETLYGKSNSIQYTDINAWKRQRQAEQASH